MGLCRQPRLRLDVKQGLRCQEPFPGQGPDQNEIRPIYLISDCSKPISTVIYSASGSLDLHLFCFVPGLWLYVCVCVVGVRVFDQIIPRSAVVYEHIR